MATRIGDARCSQIEKTDAPLLSAITTLSERTVWNRVTNARGNMLVRNAFEEEWPVDAEQLGPLTVAAARRASLEQEIAAASGLGKRKVANRLESASGKMLLANAFPELSSDDEDEDDEFEDEDEDDDDEHSAGGARVRAGEALLDGRRNFNVVNLVGAIRAVSVRNSVSFLAWLAKLLDVSVAFARRRLGSVHGRTVVRTALEGRWPPDQLEAVPLTALQGVTASGARRSLSLVRLVADGLGMAPRDVLARLSNAEGNAHVDTVLKEQFEGRTKSAGTPIARPAPMPPSPRAPRPATPQGRILDRRYLLGRELGEGGFGRVFEATRVDSPNQRVVVKLEIPDAPQSLRNEIGIAYELTHQNICSYKDYGQDRALGTYLVLQHGGRSLEDIIRLRSALDIGVAMDVVRQAAAGLDYAHKHGVIHQDVKPGNILIGDDDADWEVRVTDFGIAVKGIAARNTIGKHTVLATSPVGYTLAYASPEQHDGAKPRKASDQYSLALVFFSMLEGKVFTHPYRHRHLPCLTAARFDVLQKALSEDPDERFESCSAFAAELIGTRP